jgi:uncharacterized cupredoxin-like copper-binding protein
MGARLMGISALVGVLVGAVTSAAAPPRPCAARAAICASTRQHRPVAALGVREHEFRIGLSRITLRAGKVIVELDNEGQDVHDLRVAPVGSQQPVLAFGELRSGGRATKTVALRPGTYRLWCSLPGHEAAGMHALLRVK